MARARIRQTRSHGRRRRRERRRRRRRRRQMVVARPQCMTDHVTTIPPKTDHTDRLNINNDQRREETLARTERENTHASTSGPLAREERRRARARAGAPCCAEPLGAQTRRAGRSVGPGGRMVRDCLPCLVSVPLSHLSRNARGPSPLDVLSTRGGGLQAHAASTCARPPTPPENAVAGRVVQVGASRSFRPPARASCPTLDTPRCRSHCSLLPAPASSPFRRRNPTRIIERLSTPTQTNKQNKQTHKNKIK